MGGFLPSTLPFKPVYSSRSPARVCITRSLSNTGFPMLASAVAYAWALHK
ncbi:hypothetical protein HanRHA438_Chr06g0247331 [Helianthus annuus]|nr:hypothetical protein HanIR_Chr06g0255881 [Helianthus annuus]KAJ0909976.1 hypothetical protein HanRHA438_Chr06g0247331 [Helianthus annuus]